MGKLVGGNGNGVFDNGCNDAIIESDWMGWEGKVFELKGMGNG